MNIAIFVSGSGTNCENIIRHFAGDDSVDVCLVVSSRADAYALVRASALGVPSVVVSRSELNDETLMLSLLDSYGVDFIVLAGFMLMVPRFLTARYPQRIVNIHPSLLPKFGGRGMYGHHVHEAVKAAGETQSGITIHYVDDVCDGGAIIAQFFTPVAASDTAADIERRVRALELRYYPMVIEAVVKAVGSADS